MGKRSVPRGTTRKEMCSCGTMYYPILTGGTSMKLTSMCQGCNPNQYKPAEKKKK